MGIIDTLLTASTANNRTISNDTINRTDLHKKR